MLCLQRYRRGRRWQPPRHHRRLGASVPLGPGARQGASGRYDDLLAPLVSQESRGDDSKSLRRRCLERQMTSEHGALRRIERVLSPGEEERGAETGRYDDLRASFLSQELQRDDSKSLRRRRLERQKPPEHGTLRRVERVLSPEKRERGAGTGRYDDLRASFLSQKSPEDKYKSLRRRHLETGVTPKHGTLRRIERVLSPRNWTRRGQRMLRVVNLRPFSRGDSHGDCRNTLTRKSLRDTDNAEFRVDGRISTVLRVFYPSILPC